MAERGKMRVKKEGAREKGKEVSELAWTKKGGSQSEETGRKT